MYDIAIVGGGPAGLAAAVTAGVRHKNVVLFDAGDFGLALRKSALIKNYLGLPDISGNDLMNKFLAQAESFSPTIVKHKVLSVMPMEPNFMLAAAENVYEAKSVILALGTSHSHQLPGESSFLGKGVSYCATCDGSFYKGKKVAVIAALPSAKEDIEFLGEVCSEVDAMLTYKPAEPFKHDNIKIFSSVPKEITGAGKAQAVVTDQGPLAVDGIFIFRETDPVSNLLPTLTMNGNFIQVDGHMGTNIAGVFAAGDCTGTPWQISRACGQGQEAVLSAVSYVDKL
jgi:thioredoxin reductase (NADPH)